jgi:hypothetical protein
MRFIAVALISAFLSTQARAAGGESESSPANQAEMRQVIGRLSGEPALAEYFPACPADYFAKAATLFDALGDREGSPEDYCAQSPSACLIECVQGKNSESCFSLARAIQDHAEPAAPLQVERLFAFSCAAGKPSACTNRGGGMRNGQYDGDPSGSWAEEKLNGCLMRTFRLSCDKEDSWGCAMLGQAWLTGEGAQANSENANAAFKRACDLAPDFASCEFANSMLEMSGSE